MTLTCLLNSFSQEWYASMQNCYVWATSDRRNIGSRAERRQPRAWTASNTWRGYRNSPIYRHRTSSHGPNHGFSVQSRQIFSWEVLFFKDKIKNYRYKKSKSQRPWIERIWYFLSYKWTGAYSLHGSWKTSPHNIASRAHGKLRDKVKEGMKCLG